MGHVPEDFIKSGMTKMMAGLYGTGLVDAQVLFMGIGDHEVDQCPLQVGQFEADDQLMDKWLKDIYLESGGGGNDMQGEFKTRILDLINYALTIDDGIRNAHPNNKRLFITCLDHLNFSTGWRLTQGEESYSFDAEDTFLNFIIVHIPPIGEVYVSHGPTAEDMTLIAYRIIIEWRGIWSGLRVSFIFLNDGILNSSHYQQKQLLLLIIVSY